MCGIGGAVATSSGTIGDIHGLLAVVRDTLAHRGPDDNGLYLTPDGRSGLASTRLAIRDLSPLGHMPMANDAQTVWLTYNGELYNADELRGDLQARGYRFRSRSDTEVLLRGYEAWGAGVVDRLRGMFAFAALTVDAATGQARRLLLARDRLGIKPLYYAHLPGGLLFASELRALRATGQVGRDLSPTGLVGYLLFGAVPCPWTIYADAQALPPATTLVWDAGRVELHRYWSLPQASAAAPSPSEAVEQVRALLDDAVRAHLVSDVPLGAFLSGGLDSSALVALMRKATSGAIRTCSMVFEESAYSEAPYARAMAEAVGAEHYERVVTAADLRAEFDRILWAMDQPTIDGVNAYFVSKTAREAGLTVALSGLGGDELFGGYPNTFAGVPQTRDAIRRVQQVPAGAFVARRALEWFAAGRSLVKVAGVLDRPASLASAYVVRRGLFTPADVRRLVAPEVWQAAQQSFDAIDYVADRAAENGDTTRWVSHAELSTYTHNQLLRDTDTMSMAHSLEVRVPLLDHRLVEDVLRLPAAVRVPAGRPKALLAEAVGDLLPPLVRDRRDKRGFSFPLGDWLRQGTLAERLSAALSAADSRSALDGMLRRGEVQRLLRGHHAGRTTWSRAWAVAVLSMWAAAA